MSSWGALVGHAVAWTLVAPAAEAGVAASAPQAGATLAPSSALAEATADLSGRFALGVAAGQLGSEPLYILELAYFPSARFGLEATLAHNPSGGTHAALHHASGIVPLGWWRRVRPYALAGLGTIQVFPGTAINAKSVTKLALHAGGGAHLHLRDAVALRLEARAVGIIDDQEERRGLLGYPQWSVGLMLTRDLESPRASPTEDP